MMNNLAPARARESAEAWLADRKLALPTPPRVSAAFAEQAMADAFAAGWSQATAPGSEAEVNEIVVSLVRDAIEAAGDSAPEEAAAVEAAQRIVAYLGAIHREEQDQWAIERAQGQRQLDAPGQPDAENPEVGEDWFKTARLVHGLAPTAAGKVPGRQQAALLNGAIGLRVEKRSGDYDFDGEVRAVIVKRSGEVRYAVEDDRGLLLVMNARQCGLEEVARLEAPWRKEGVADLAAFRLTTGDPRFDPGKPVCVNGYRYTPTKED